MLDGDPAHLAVDDDLCDDLLVLAGEEAPAGSFEVITPEELIREQQLDLFFTKVRSRINGGEQLPLAANNQGYLVRTVKSTPQIVVPHTLQRRVLRLSHHSKLGGHPGGRKLYPTLRRDFYWPEMSLDCYALLRECVPCARNQVRLRKHAKQLQLFLAQAPLEYVAIDILGEFIATPRRKRYLLVITDRFSKLVRTVPLASISASEVAKAFVSNWLLPMDPRLYFYPTTARSSRLSPLGACA